MPFKPDRNLVRVRYTGGARGFQAGTPVKSMKSCGKLAVAKVSAALRAGNAARYQAYASQTGPIMEQKPADSGTNPYALNDPAQLARNMVRVGQQSQKLLSDFL